MNQPHHPEIPTIPEIDPETAEGMLRRGQAILLDVREPDEWAAGHAPAATHQPLDSLRPELLDRDATVITVCRSGGRSARAAGRLAGDGYRVCNLAGGMTAWSRAGLAVRTDDDSPGTVA